MKNIEEIRTNIAPLKEVIQQQYSVSRIELFSSYVRGEQNEDRDLDVVGLEIFLSEMLQTKVDVVLRRSVRPELKEIIFSEAVLV